MTMSHARIALCAMALLSAPLSTTSHAAAVMAADQGSGYAGQVMEKVVKTWQAPQYPSEHTVRVQVRIDGDGAVLSCTPVQSSNLALLDKSACDAVRETKKYPSPPYGMPIDVFLTFWTGLPAVANLGASPDTRAIAAQATRNEQQASAATAAALALARAAETRAVAANKGAAAKGGKANTPTTVSPGTSLSPRGTPPATPVTSAGTTKSGTVATPKQAATKAPVPAKAPVAQAKVAVPTATRATPQPTAQATAKTTVAAAAKDSGVLITKSTAATPPPAPPAETAAPAPVLAPAAPASPAPSASAPPSEGRIVQPRVVNTAQPTGNMVGLNAEEPTAEEGRYARKIRWTIREAMLIPAELPMGEYTFTIYVRLSETGQITKADLTHSSGDPLMDKYAMRGIKRVTELPPPPTKKLRDLHLTFVVQRS